MSKKRRSLKGLPGTRWHLALTTGTACGVERNRDRKAEVKSTPFVDDITCGICWQLVKTNPGLRNMVAG